MKNMKYGFIAKNQKNRMELKGIIVISVFLAVAINILVYGFCELFKDYDKARWIYFGIGLLLLIIILIIYLMSQKANSKQSMDFSGMIIIKDNDEIVDIPAYRVSEDMNRNISSAFSEKKALEMQWKNSEKIDIFHDSAKKKLIIELIQYCILCKLSTCLTDYFNENKDDKHHLKEYAIQDISTVLLNNRFLKLFTEPMKDREAFMPSNSTMRTLRFDNDDDKEGKIVSATGKNGALYNLFELCLPEKTSITMPNENTICLDMQYIVMQFEIKFEGFNTFVCDDFHKYYLDIDSRSEINDYLFRISFVTKIKHPLFIGKKQSFYYEWIDLFMEEMDEYLSSDSFFKKIGWGGLQAQIRILKNKTQNREGNR